MAPGAVGAKFWNFELGGGGPVYAIVYPAVYYFSSKFVFFLTREPPEDLGRIGGDQIPPSFIKIHCNPVAILAQVILTEAIFAQAGAPEAQ